jgi:hypothetical protein
MVNKNQEMRELFEQFLLDAEKFIDKKNKAAGARARKATTKLSTLFLEFRKASVAEEKTF